MKLPICGTLIRSMSEQNKKIIENETACCRNIIQYPWFVNEARLLENKTIFSEVVWNPLKFCYCSIWKFCWWKWYRLFGNIYEKNLANAQLNIYYADENIFYTTCKWWIQHVNTCEFCCVVSNLEKFEKTTPETSFNVNVKFWKITLSAKHFLF